jgi:hypothetical protein
MNEQQKIQAAWDITELMAKLNDLLWDQYKDQFIERCIKSEEDKFWDQWIKNDLDSESF